MPQLTPQANELLEKALTLSSGDRGAIIQRLIQSLDDEPAEEGVEAAWSEEIKRRVQEIELGTVEMIPGEELSRFAFIRRRGKSFERRFAGIACGTRRLGQNSAFWYLIPFEK
jgi:putative addiction module component (TIGR02574 family)